MARDVVWRAGSGVAHYQAIGLHGIEIECGVEKRLALLEAGGFGLQIHGVRTEARGGGAEADAGASGGFEKGERDGFAAEGRELFQRMALNFLKRFALIEKES